VAVSVVNQWAGTFNQPSSFANTSPALQSVVVALTAGNSVGGGSGTPTAGNWLFCLVAMNEAATTSGFTVGVGDDIHSFWRPGNETNSTWAVSTGAALTRTAIWYAANISAVAGNVYVAPNGCFDAFAVLVVEVSGLGPWDTVTGINTNYAAAATTLNLALGAPSASAFLIAGIGGDNTANGQAFAPASWTTLHTVQATNGTDHTSDAQLNSAWIVTSGSISVNGTAVSAIDLSGAVIGVLAVASSPIPASQNPTWPLVKLEAAFGGGFQTPPDQLTWTDLSSRAWSWDETTGIQFQLNQVQATNLLLELDNNDNALSTDNPQALPYSNKWSPLAGFYDGNVSELSPLGWWKLNDASGSGTAADSSGNAHTGTATSVTFGNASEAVNGNTSAAFASGSTSHILTTYNPGPLSAITVEAWVNYNSLSQGGNSPRLVANGHPDVDNKGFQLMANNSGQPQFWVGNATTNGNAAGGSVPATGWTYIVGTYDGTNVKIYVNGVLQTTSGFSGTVAAGLASGIGLGYNPTYNGDYLNGLLSEAAVYGTALTAQEIISHYLAGPAGTGTPVRLRAAIGTLGGNTVNRWYVIQRNIQELPQEINSAYRRYVPATGTDIWSTLSSFAPTPYRGEVYQDSPYAWWPCDDQPLAGGVLPVSLINAANGNSNVLNIKVSPNGAITEYPYSEAGVTTSGLGPPTAAVYTVGANQGWMYGDPQSSPSSFSSGSPVTTNPGAASWQAFAEAGNTGSQGWFLYCNDAAFPVLANGVTVEGWFNYTFFGSSSTVNSGGASPLCQQPQTALTLFELATDSNPVAIMQLDTSGNLNFITYSGATPTSHSIYATSDLRSQSWVHVAVSMTTSAWTVYVNGGATALVSGSGTSMTSAWDWLIVNGDLAANGGSTAGTGLVHGGNVSVSHLAVYSSRLPAWRVLAHYVAAVTGFGQMPAPTAIEVDWTNTNGASSASGIQTGYYAPDGTGHAGAYTALTGVLASARVTANAPNAVTSGPSAWATSVAYNTLATNKQTLWVQWGGVAPTFTVYTANAVGSETSAATVAGSGDSFISGYGAAASGQGVCQVAAGSGASPPASASALGDTVQQRIERILGYGQASYPGRCIDPASLAVQSASDIGGQQVGQNTVNIAQSDSGLLFVDNLGNLTYWQKSHLDSQYSSPVWTITPNAPPTPGASASAVPYYKEGFSWVADPQKIWNTIQITPYSPDGASLATVTPVSVAAVLASQGQYGAQVFQITSYLQSQSEMQTQANWILANYGVLQIRVSFLRIDAAPYPAAWPLILGVNVGDVVTCQNWQLGNTGATGTFRVSNINRKIRFGGMNDDNAGEGIVVASVELTLDFEPSGYWS
jgi:hypothetical protein